MGDRLDRDALLAFILKWIEEDKGLSEGSIQADETFDDLGLDSLSRMTLAGEVFDTFGCEFEASVMWDCESPTAVVDVLTQEAPASAINTLSDGDAPHIVLIFGLGGTARDLYPIAEGMKRVGSFSVSAIEQPFSEDAQVDDAIETIRFISDAIVGRFGDEPVIPFGYSFGGLMALGVADDLRSRGLHVPFTALLDTNHPDAARDPVSKGERVATLVRHLPGWVAETIVKAPSGQLKPGLRAFKRELRHLAGALRGDDRPGLKDVVRSKGRPPAWDARTEQNFHLLCDYRPGSHEGDVLLLRAKTRPLDGSLNHAQNGWSSVIDGDITVKGLRGTHSTLLNPDRLLDAGAILASTLQSHGMSLERSGSS